MKKEYIAPAQTIVIINLESHLMDLSESGSASVSSDEADVDGFVKEDFFGSSNNVWDDDWDD